MSYTNLLYHIVFRTKSSRPAINVEHERDMYSYLFACIKNAGGVTHRIGGMPDHVHVLANIPPTISVADFMRNIKTATSVFLRSHPREFPLFDGWGKSYCALTYGKDDRETIRRYIMNQKEHHKRVSFAEELRCLLIEQGVEFDEKYFLSD